MNVLLVDDEPNMRKMLRLMLQSRGFQVLEAASGEEALTVSAAQSIDCLVTDVVMDGMDGFALARAMSERHPDLPVLFMSGYPTNFDGVRPSHGRCDFLPKPFQKADLIRALTALLSTDGHG